MVWCAMAGDADAGQYVEVEGRKKPPAPFPSVNFSI